jgi:hypothetical protein
LFHFFKLKELIVAITHPIAGCAFNPKPYATVGINPVNFRIHNETIGNTEKWYFINGAFNYGLDFDIWLTDYFALSLTYEKVLFFAKVFDTMYDEESGLPFEYSKFKIGIIF